MTAEIRIVKPEHKATRLAELASGAFFVLANEVTTAYAVAYHNEDGSVAALLFENNSPQGTLQRLASSTLVMRAQLHCLEISL